MKLNEFTPCIVCGKGVAQGGAHFFRVRVDHMALDAAAIQRETDRSNGPGHATIHTPVKPGDDLAHLSQSTTALICASCGTSERMPVAYLLEAAA